MESHQKPIKSLILYIVDRVPNANVCRRTHFISQAVSRYVSAHIVIKVFKSTSNIMCPALKGTGVHISSRSLLRNYKSVEWLGTPLVLLGIFRKEINAKQFPRAPSNSRCAHYTLPVDLFQGAKRWPHSLQFWGPILSFERDVEGWCLERGHQARCVYFNVLGCFLASRE